MIGNGNQYRYTLVTSKNDFPKTYIKKLLQQALDTKEWMCKGIFNSRAKDYDNPFRKMVYDTNEEMNNVIGRLEDNNFIQEQIAEFEDMKKQVRSLLKKL